MNLPSQLSSVVRRRSQSEVSELVSAFKQSGQGLTEFCRQHQIAPSSITRHMRRRSATNSSSALSASNVRSSSKIPQAAASLLAVDLVGSAPSQDQHRHPGIQTAPIMIELPRDIRIAVQRDFDETTLLRLIAVLGKA